MTNFIIICHGKSETILAKWLQNEAHIPLDIDSRDGGERSILLNSLVGFMKENGYYDGSKLKRRFPDIEYRNRKGFKDLRIFIIMDVDTDRSLVNDYLTKVMFKDCPLKGNITSILNRNDMDSVFRGMGFGIDEKHKPESYRDVLNATDVDELLRMLKGRDDTNLDVMIEELLSHAPDHQGKVGRLQ